LGGENGGGRVKRPGSTGGIHSLHPHIIAGERTQLRSNSNGGFSRLTVGHVNDSGSDQLVVNAEYIVVVGDGAGKSDADIYDMVGADVGWGRRSRRSRERLGRRDGCGRGS